MASEPLYRKAKMFVDEILDDDAVLRWVVQVEPCVHGNYAPHVKPTVEWVGVRIDPNTDMCDGKPEVSDGD